MSREILIIGGGVMGLSIAVELTLRGASVTVMSRDSQQAASQAAGGMLAPQAENLRPGPMLELCLQSRSLYRDWTQKLESLSGLPTGYWPCGILAPVYDSPESTPVSDAGPSLWLDSEALQHYQPGLGADVIGAWWYPEDAQVDNRALMRSLLGAVEALGIELKEGLTVEAIAQEGHRISGVQTQAGRLTADHYVLAAGSWSNQLLPLPLKPIKGQMFSVRAPQVNGELPLRRVLYGPNTYIIPRGHGQIVIGATSEDVGFVPGTTPEGLRSLLERAIRLYPALKNYPMEEIWSGFRPGTPDELPILGDSYCDNLTLATGHYRNGILLAPITAKLTADLICDNQRDPLLGAFAWNRPQPSSPSPNATMLSHTRETPPQSLQVKVVETDPLQIAGRSFRSRLMTGSGKYNDFETMRGSIAASGCEIVTVAVRRVQTNAPGHEGLAEALDWSKIWMLPNTAGCKTAEEAIRVARLGREMAKLLGQEDNNFIKLEVIPDSTYLLPDPIGTLEAAEQLVKEGFAVLPYINADPMLAKRLEEVGCATVMPLGSPIGSGQGIQTAANIRIIIENAKVPVVVDAGIGTPSEAAFAMELGADAVLINSAIALAQNPVAMGQAMGMAVIAGRLAHHAGRIPIQAMASASSPLTGTISG
ncbi:glycine oxidase ThiO [Geitlerinema sp. P-1104]|uniref:glycine oxidase ThiO n=1 Tax=Geitlerinema sp. P-1104 TaxID=2546230 RepID=UPI001476D5AC|nr:glycine oxidase ThiO [Geitlerinema sp. P-1104]NMG57600.1 glycine oxidase ThiO [Geitlerinema sp. P-1104]